MYTGDTLPASTAPVAATAIAVMYVKHPFCIAFNDHTNDHGQIAPIIFRVALVKRTLRAGMEWTCSKDTRWNTSIPLALKGNQPKCAEDAAEKSKVIKQRI